ncbi:hemin uptake protein HemP [Reyranella sp. MMS21-HV4-11]|jgi:hemin uptake protein HemP|uniref:Hemin uptake protein HemP n=1 Tax=Reyranella humidisoli TaxID=2849149 RepID=A0ABS6IEL9_9HYPH|nr:hemin uptake protein HemP [Reyranella sp. MMS21-HV4-11]MBU8872683.1 hemin uptake protein HemP [Reyranella sp. MMS21-HV4-11]
MDDRSGPARIDEMQRDRSAFTLPAVESVAILQGRREVIIRHGAELYRLRLTASNKLILTK